MNQPEKKTQSFTPGKFPTTVVILYPLPLPDCTSAPRAPFLFLVSGGCVSQHLLVIDWGRAGNLNLHFKEIVNLLFLLFQQLHFIVG